MSLYLRPESQTPALPPEADLMCFSHLRWNFVFQRPQHLMTRYARVQRVFFVEEPVFDEIAEPELSVEAQDGVSRGRAPSPFWAGRANRPSPVSGCCSTG